MGRPEEFPEGLDGVEKMYLAPLEDTVREVTTLAAKAGVRHIVDVSGPKDSWWAPVATAVEESGVPWTHLTMWSVGSDISTQRSGGRSGGAWSGSGSRAIGSTPSWATTIDAARRGRDSPPIPQEVGLRPGSVTAPVHHLPSGLPGWRPSAVNCDTR